MVEGAMSRLGRKASVAALVAGVLVAVASSAGAGARSSHRGGLPAACASLDAPTPPVRAVPGTAATNGPYAIFRRPQAPADLLPPDAAGQLDTLASYDPTATRLVFTTGVARVYLVRGRRQKLVVPGACLSRLPRAYARTVRLLERELAGQAAVCFSLEQTRHRANGAVEQSASTGCVPAVAGTGGYAVVTLEGNSALEVGLVPDGVARVDVRYRTGRTVEGTVRTNIVAYRPPSLTVGGQGLRGPRPAAGGGAPAPAPDPRLDPGPGHLARRPRSGAADLHPAASAAARGRRQRDGQPHAEHHVWLAQLRAVAAMRPRAARRDGAVGGQRRLVWAAGTAGHLSPKRSSAGLSSRCARDWTSGLGIRRQGE